MDELKAFLQEHMRNAYDLKEEQTEQMRPWLMRASGRFFILQRRNVIYSMFMFHPRVPQAVTA